MKRRIIVISSILLAFVALFAFNKITSNRPGDELFTEVKQGIFEISVSNSGELLAEKSLDIRGPDIFQQQMQQGNRGGGGHDMGIRIMDMKIQDIVAEGTIVKQGDYIAQIDRSSYSNTLKDALDQLKTYQTNVEMKVLDTAVTLTNLRDDIKNQRYAVEEAQINLDQSKFEPPATIRQAEIKLDKAQRSLEQKLKGYKLRSAQTLSEINHEKMHLEQQQKYVESLQTFLQGFTILAPAPGMVIYKKDRMGNKRKAGSSLNPFDNVVATVPDLSVMLSKVYVNEIEVAKVKPGMKTNITIDAFPKKAYTGTVMTVANIGEQLPNSDSKMFEVMIKIDGNDPSLRPSMTSTNKIIIKTYDNVVYVPTECVMAGTDSIPFVYEKNRTKQYVVVGEANDKNVIIEQGLEPGKMIYAVQPDETSRFRAAGEDLMKITRERNNARRLENQRLTQAAITK